MNQKSNQLMRLTLPVIKLILLLLFCLSLSQCQKKLELNNKKVILTPVGELVETTQYVGDNVKFRIYFKNPESQIVDVEIVDTLHPLLKNPLAYNGGVIEEVSLTARRKVAVVRWIIPNVAAKGSGFVEVSGKVSGASSPLLIMNRAHICFYKPGTIEKPVFKEGKPVRNASSKALECITTNKVIDL